MMRPRVPAPVMGPALILAALLYAVPVLAPPTPDEPDGQGSGGDSDEPLFGLLVEWADDSAGASRHIAGETVFIPRDQPVRFRYVPRPEPPRNPSADPVDRSLSFQRSDARSEAAEDPGVVDLIWDGRPVDPEGIAVVVEPNLMASTTVRALLRVDDEEELSTLAVARVVTLDVSRGALRAEIEYPGEANHSPLDLDGDFYVENGDLDRLWSAYGSRTGEPGYNRAADWDGNGTIDLMDLVPFVDRLDAASGQEVGVSYGGGLIHPVTGRPRSDEFAFSIPPPLFRASTGEGLDEWIVWRRNGLVVETGATWSRPMYHPGESLVTAEVLGASASGERKLEIYRTRIVNFRSNWDRLTDGVPYTFIAETEPPGYEDYVTWYASTLHGLAIPEHGRGPTFTVKFDRTWESGRWLGVQADNAYFNLDVKVPAIFNIFPISFTEFDVVTIDGDHFPPDYFDMDLYFVLQDSSLVTLDSTDVFNFDADPEGERITGMVGPVPDQLISSPATFVFLRGEGEPFNVPSTLLASGEEGGPGDAAPPIANAVLFQKSEVDYHTDTGGLTITDPPPDQFVDFRGLVDAVTDRIDIDLTGSVWLPNTRYEMRGCFSAAHLNGATEFYCSWPFELSVTFTTDATPTVGEAAVQIAGKFETLIEGGEEPGGIYCGEHFQCVAVGNIVRLQKRAGSSVNLIEGDPLTGFSTGVVGIREAL